VNKNCAMHSSRRQKQLGVGEGGQNLSECFSLDRIWLISLAYFTRNELSIHSHKNAIYSN